MARCGGLLLVAFACILGCSGRSKRQNSPAPAAGASSIAGAGGAAGSAGTAASAGISGEGGGFGGSSGGAGGSEPSAGATNGGATAGAGLSSGGSGATGGGGSGDSGGGDAGGTGNASGAGGAVSFPECSADEDCEVTKDCCACQAVPKGASFATCRLDCGDGNACEMQGLSPVAQCTLGRCTLAVSCDARGVVCEAPTPTCPRGEAPSVNENGCWGPCAPSTECSAVSDCAACGDALCVPLVDVGGAHYRCISPQAQCEVGNLCECLAPCGNLGCAEEDGEVGCYCALC